MVAKPAVPPPAPASVPFRTLWRWGWVVVRGAPGWFALSTAVSLVAQLAAQYAVQILGAAVSLLTAQPGVGPARGFLPVPHDKVVAVVAFAALSAGAILLTWLDRVLTVHSDAVLLGRLQRRLHDRLLGLGPSFHGKHDAATAVAIVSRFSVGAEMILRDLVSAPLTRGIGLATALVFLADNLVAIRGAPAPMKAAMVVFLVALPIVAGKLVARSRPALAKTRDAELALLSELTTSTERPLEVQLLGAEALRARAFGDKVDAHVRARLASTLRTETASQVQKALPQLLGAAFLVYAALRARPDEAGAIVALFYFVPAAVAPIQQLLLFASGLALAWPQIEKVVAVLEAEPDVRERAGARALPGGNLGVELRGVTFRYAPSAPAVLDDASHVFAAGKVTALVARIGGGKSTALDLVARLRDPEAGAVVLGGLDARDATLASLRARVAKVSQFPLYLPASIRENLRLARADATDDQLRAALERTGLWTALERLAPDDPLGWTLPRNAAEGLSGGQRRLLAITRALLTSTEASHRPVVLLDEPTTGIDALGRRALVDVVRGALQGATVLVVDHDMEFVRAVADEIVVLDGGKVAEVGAPDALARAGGLFQRLCEATGEAKDAQPAA
jgi:ABC-type multidrug transport system fused ATPase/permease subunit